MSTRRSAALAPRSIASPDFLSNSPGYGALPGSPVLPFEEAVRYESPVQTFFRTTTRPVEIGGIAVGEGEKVLTFLSAANRDPRHWERPDEFDINRRVIGHVGFGSGIHQCVGQLSARLEGECVRLLRAKSQRLRSPVLLGRATTIHCAPWRACR